MTTHWANLKVRPHKPTIYVADGHKSAYAMRPGDRVLIYEFKGGPTVIDSATGDRLFRSVGAEAVVAAIEIVGPLHERSKAESLQAYVGRPPIDWKWEAMTRVIATGKVSRAVVNKELGYKPAYNFHGYGPKGCGFNEIKGDVFAKIRARLL
jgi:hypothetical protein